MATDQSAQMRARLLTGAVRRRKGLVALLGLACLVLGLAAGFVVPKTYTAQATVLVNPLEGNPFSPEGRGDDLINLQTEAQLVETDPVTQAVADELGGAVAAEDLRTQVSVEVPPNTQVLEVAFDAGDADSARDGAQAFATSYLDYRKQRAEGVVENRVKGLRDQIEQVEKDLEDATDRRSVIAAGSSEASFLSERISAYVDQLAVLNEQVNDATSTPVQPGQVITPAELPERASGPGMLLFGGAGAVAGLALGLALAVARELRDDRVYDAQTLESLGATVVSEIPTTRDDEGLVVLTAPTEQAGEAYRRLRAAVVANIPQTPAVLLVTSVTRGRSAVLTSANLAAALSRTAVSTVLVDAHASGRGPSHMFRLTHSPGLSNVLLEGADPVPLLVQAGPSLRLLPAGTNPVEGAERYPGPQMREAIDGLRHRADVVIVCAPSIQEADGQALCTVADTALLVVSLGTTSTEDLDHATAEVERCGATVLGTVAKHGGAARPAKATQPDRAAAAGRGAAVTTGAATYAATSSANGTATRGTTKRRGRGDASPTVTTYASHPPAGETPET